MIYVGIDPGKDGAIAYIKENGKKGARVVPKIGSEYDKHEMVKVLKDLNPTHVVLENINSHSAKGRQGAFVMGKGVAYWEMALIALKIPHTMVTPQVWQKEMWAGVKVQRKPSTKKKKDGSPALGSKDTKATSMVAASRLFPDFDFTPTEKATKKHDGMIDAMLMAEYCKRNF